MAMPPPKDWEWDKVLAEVVEEKYRDKATIHPS